MIVFHTTNRAQSDDRHRASEPPAEREEAGGCHRLPALHCCFEASQTVIPVPLNDRQLSLKEESVTAGLLLHLRAAG